MNPTNLMEFKKEVVTPKENIIRGQGITAINARKTHCKDGHPFCGKNLRKPKRGGRVCRTCHRNSSRNYREINKIT